MRKLSKDLAEHLQEVGWALFILCLLLACLAYIFGRKIGFELTALVCLGFALVIATIFAVIVAANLIWVGLTAIVKRFSKRSIKK